MTNLKTIQQAIKDKCPLRQAEENLKIEQEQRQAKERIQQELKKMGVMIL